MGLDNPLHIAFLVVILLLVFGAKRLPEIGRSLGSGMREFKQSITGESPPQQPALGAPPQQAAIEQPAPQQATPQQATPQQAAPQQAAPQEAAVAPPTPEQAAPKQ
jgi:sec-independent protein translocase protein TatA